MGQPAEYIVLDFETTGLEPGSAEIIEVGAIRVRGTEEVESFHRLVKPQGDPPRAITQLTGITREMLADQPAWATVGPELAAFLGDSPIVAHNAALEQKFLDHFLSPLIGGRILKTYNSIEPIALILPDHASHALESLRKWTGIVTENAHRADQDCRDTLAVLHFTREWMFRERPYLPALVLGYLGGPDGELAFSENRWWWQWYFEPEDGNLLSAQPPARPDQGGLRQMREADSGREIDWTRTAPAESVRGVLRGETLAMPDPDYQPRETQLKMAEEVRHSLEKGSRVAIEAPTGTGKSVAYLVPGALTARATGVPLVISTHSKALQDQLLEKDLPRVRNLAGLPELRATTVKGQENYVCLRKLNDTLASVTPESPLEERFAAAYLAAFNAAHVKTPAELDRVSHYLKVNSPALSAMVEQVRSHHTTTLGPTCPYFRQCHYFDSARIAHRSDVIIANHALVFRWPVNLPQIRNLVFDEAHHLEDQITDAYTIRLSEDELAATVDRLARRAGSRKISDSVPVGRLLAKIELGTRAGSPPEGLSRDLVAETQARLTEHAEQLRAVLRELSLLVPRALPGGGGSEFEESIQLGLQSRAAAQAPMMEAFARLRGAVSQLATILGDGVEGAAKAEIRNDPALDLLKLHADRFASYRERLGALISGPEEQPALAPKAEPAGAGPSDAQKAAIPNWLRLVHWNGRESVWRFTVSPIEVAALAAEFFASKRSIVLTSATLTSGGAQGADFVTGRVGLPLTKPLVALPSPYPLATQGVIYFPDDVAPPGTPSHLDAIIDFTEKVATALGGRTLLLMTSNRRLSHAANLLASRLQSRGIEVFDSVSDRRAADRFRACERGLLIGSERYGEGLDIPGPQLSCVIIEKINESMTRSPLAEARKARTKFGLYDYDFPLRMMWLKQRVGRLIRSPTDTGAVVIFDGRYHGWSAGSRAHVDRALAPMPVRKTSREKIIARIEAAYGEAPGLGIESRPLDPEKAPPVASMGRDRD